jgi:hypothetical protein
MGLIGQAGGNLIGQPAGTHRHRRWQLLSDNGGG